MPDSPKESRPEPEPQTDPSPQLNCITPRDDPERAKQETMRARIAAILSAIVTLILVFHWLTNNLWFGPVSNAPPPTYGGPIIATAIAFLILSSTGLWYYTHDRSTAFFKGILIGIGIAALIEGFCFGLILGK
jgi:hypothetical protein